MGKGSTDEFLEARGSLSGGVVPFEVLSGVIEEFEITEEDDERGFLASDDGIDRFGLKEVECLTVSTELFLFDEGYHRPLHYIYVYWTKDIL